MLNFDLLFAGAGSKLVPVIVTAVLGMPIVGVKSVIVGDPDPPTMNAVLLVALPAGDVTLIGPVVAPEGTEVTMRVAVADVTFVVTPLNVTVF